ncbi:androgen-induced gene 1 protein-like [Plodia interpunctella]|uniref:androgen-induced gene 1 protein-like n=1 Tax=Plodia interpunctella TaxID=58824 RepID=UPI002368847E|nr:androgen-induced gene 1 protein-like [Plodia interpunctella]
MFRPAFHLSVVLLNVFSVWYDQTYLDLPFPNEMYASMPFKARQVFLTIWCFILQTLYFSVSFLNDISGTNAPAPNKTPLIRTIKDNLFSLAFPMALYVSTFFWAIYYIDKESVFPDYIEMKFPVWLNHMLHTFVAVFVLIEIFITNRTYPSRSFGISLMITFASVYTIWMHIVHARNGLWPYPMFEVFNIPQRIGYFAVSAAFQVGYYIFGEKLHGALAEQRSVPYANGHTKKIK